MSDETPGMSPTYHNEVEHFTVGEDSASLTMYAIRDETGRIVERGVLTLWPCWDDRRGVCVARGSILAYSADGEISHSLRVEAEKPRGTWDSRTEAEVALRARSRWHWSIRNEEAVRHTEQPAQEPAKESEA